MRLIVGTEALGHYEAARLLAQPMMVLAFGLQSVLRPGVMDAAMRRDVHTARRLREPSSGSCRSPPVSYGLVAGVQWPGNPLPGLFPNAYQLQWIVLAMILAVAFQQSTGIFSLQAIAARRERDLVRLQVPNSPVYPTTAALLAGPLGAYAMAVGIVADRLTWWIRFRPILTRIYRPGAVGDFAPHAASRPPSAATAGALP